MRKLALLAAAAFAATAVPASATITFGNQTAGQGQTVQFPVQPDGATVIGFTNQTNTSVTFSTLTGQTLHTPSQGQARVEAILNGVQVGLTSILISLTDPLQLFDYAEFNMFNGGSPGNATSVTIYGTDQFGTEFHQDISLVGNGENFVSFIAASDGQHIRSIAFNNVTGGFTDLRQLRIDGLQGPNVPVPEASTWAMMIIGFGAAGVAIRRSRRRKALLAQIA
jgi:hypothetical protein